MALETSSCARPSLPVESGGTLASDRGAGPSPSPVGDAPPSAAGTMGAALSAGVVLGGTIAAASVAGSGSGSGSGRWAGSPLLQPTIRTQTRQRRADRKGAMLLSRFRNYRDHSPP